MEIAKGGATHATIPAAPAPAIHGVAVAADEVTRSAAEAAPGAVVQTEGSAGDQVQNRRRRRKRRITRPGPNDTAKPPSKRRKLLASGGGARGDDVPARPDRFGSDRRGEEANAGEQTTNESRDDDGERPRKRQRVGAAEGPADASGMGRGGDEANRTGHKGDAGPRDAAATNATRAGERVATTRETTTARHGTTQADRPEGEQGQGADGKGRVDKRPGDTVATTAARVAQAAGIQGVARAAQRAPAEQVKQKDERKRRPRKKGSRGSIHKRNANSRQADRRGEGSI